MPPRPDPGSRLARARRHDLKALPGRRGSILPRGESLPDHVWQRRHTALLWLLWLHAPGIALFGLGRGYGLGHALGEAAAITVIALLATVVPRRIRSRKAAGSLVSIGLLTSSGLVVHFSGGLIEAHFHFS